MNTNQFFFRGGCALSGSDNERVQIGSQGQSGHLIRDEACPRCSGQGGSSHWRPDGGICYQCRGKATVVRSHRVFTADKLAKLDAAAKVKSDKVEAKRLAAEAAHRVDFERWAYNHVVTIHAIETIAKPHGDDFFSVARLYALDGIAGIDRAGEGVGVLDRNNFGDLHDVE